MKKKLADLSKKVKIILTKGLTEDLINKYNIIDGAHYSCLDESQNYLLFQSLFNYVITESDAKLLCGNLKKCRKKVLKLHLQQTLAFIQK